MSSTKYTSSTLLASPVLFSPQSTCLASTALFYIQNSGSSSGFSDVFGVPTDTVACFPSGWSSAGPVTFISPALCPSSYTAANSSTVTSSTVTETGVICCPSHFSPMTSPNSLIDPGFYCISFFGTTTLTETVVTLGASVGLTTISRGSGYLKAYSIQARYQSTDYIVSGTSTLAVVTSSLAVSSPSQASSSPSQASSSSSSVAVAATDTQSETGLSQSAKIGIGITIPLIAITMIALGVWCLLRRRRHQNSPHMKSPPPDMPVFYGDPGTDTTPSRIPAASTELPTHGSDLPELGVELEDYQGRSNRERDSYMPHNTGSNTRLPATNTTYPEGPINFESHNRSGHRGSSQSIEELERRLNKTREEKERIAQLSQLSRLEEDLERQIAEQRR